MAWKKLTIAMMGCLFFTSGLASQNDKVTSLYDLMSYQEVLPITISVDLDSIKLHRYLKDEIKTSVSFRSEKEELLVWDANIEVRGKFRRRHCTVPPLKLNFKKSQLRKAGLAAFDDFDIVTYCLNDPELAKELVIKEYLAYKLYNEITDYSYRVQMIQITFKNPQTGKEDIIWGFLMEDTAELAARINAEKVDTLIALAIDFDQELFNNMFVFQSMIGNVDWSLKPVKNLKIFRKGQTLIPIPYDFDFSILVDAPYAKVSINSVLRSQKQLELLDTPELDEAMKKALAFYQTKRQSILNIAQNLKILSLAPLEKAVRHLNGFLDSPYRLAIPVLVKPAEEKEPKY